MKPRILIFSIAYDPLLGGAELAVRNLTDRLFATHEFDLITARFSRGHKAHERIGKVNVYRVGFGSRLGRYLYPVLAFRLAVKLHRQHPYQIIWSIMAAYAGAAALMFLRRNPEVKFLLTLQEGDAIEHIYRQVRGLRGQWQRIFKRADYVQAISQYLADWAKKEGATCPIMVVPNGVNPLSFSPSPSARGGAEGGDERGGRKIIITTSRLVPKNGIDILIKAIADLRSIIPDSKFIIQILGTGPEEKTLKKLTRDLKVEDCVEFLGDVDPDKVPEYLAKADIFVRPSRSEGLGTAFLEAMAAGLPVIGTRVGGIPDFLIPLSVSPPYHKGEMKRGIANGVFCKPDDPKDLAEKILLLLENEDLRQELGQNGRRLVEEKYDWDLIAKKIAVIFAGLVS